MIRVAKDDNEEIKMDTTPQKGRPFPQGPTYNSDQLNFSLHAPKATHVKLLLFDNSESLLEKLDMYCTNTHWHIAIKTSGQPVFYQYEIETPEGVNIICDPFSPFSTSSTDWGSFQYRDGKVKSIAQKPQPFDWEGVQPPCHPLSHSIIYEMHIRGFTKHHQSNVKYPGTFLGAIEKIDHLKELGITTIELLPIQEFNEAEIDPPLTNYWGYSTLNFFQIMNRYLTTPNQINQLKTFVKALHEAEIEVILDVVYNHTSRESALFASDLNYYILSEDQMHTNYTGCGNSIHGNSKQAIDLIQSSLEYLVQEFHIDGFRFDLASTLVRDEKGHPIDNPPLIEALCKSSILNKVKLISEPWDPGGLYQVGSFPGHFADWNGWYRDIARRYINGFEIDMEEVRLALNGSAHLFKKKSPADSINFITVHDGFSLFDLVSYEHKHNEANLEENRDGSDVNFSINFGHEGDLKELQPLREQQVKNFALFLFCSLGTPMILMGDEWGWSHHGNNNPWCQDNEINYLPWQDMNNTIFDFFKHIIALRKHHSGLCAQSYESSPCWQFHEQSNPNVLMAFLSVESGPSLCCAFNPQSSGADIELPGGYTWSIEIQTNDSSTINHLPPHSSFLAISSK